MPKPQAVGDSLYEYLDGIGKPIVRALQHIQAINASDEFAALVGIAPGTAMLLMTRVGYLEDNTPIEVTDTYCRNDYYDFVAELRCAHANAKPENRSCPKTTSSPPTAGFAADWSTNTAKSCRSKAVPCDPADNDLPYLLPGFIDLHVHGGGGNDIMEGGDAFDTITRTHVRYGTTALLATTMTAPSEEISSVLGRRRRDSAEQRPKGSARVLGVHLEGPYINPGKLGAQPNFARTALLAEVEGATWRWRRSG